MNYVLKYTDTNGITYSYTLSSSKQSSTNLCVNTDEGIKYAPLTDVASDLDTGHKLRMQCNSKIYGIRKKSEPIVLVPANTTSPTGTLTSDKGSLGLYGTDHGNSEWLTWSTYDKIPAMSGTSGWMGNYDRRGTSTDCTLHAYNAVSSELLNHTHGITYTNGITCATVTDNASNYSAIGLKAYENAEYIPSGAYIFVKIANDTFNNIGTLQAFDNKSVYINPSSNEFQINSDKSGLPYNLTVSYSFTPSITPTDTNTTTWGSTNNYDNGKTSFYTYRWHNHSGNTVIVSLSNRPNILQFKGMTLMVYQLSQNIELKDLPSGSGMFFKTSLIPNGWALDKNQDLPIILGNIALITRLHKISIEDNALTINEEHFLI